MTLSLTNIADVELDNVNTVSSSHGRISAVAKLNEDVTSRVGKFRVVAPTELAEEKIVSKIKRSDVIAVDVPIRYAQVNRIVANSVPGSVIRDLGNGLVLCNVRVEGNEVEITLPDYCFDFAIEFGKPFYYAMADRGGYSSPVVSERDPDPVSPQDLLVFDKAIKMFSSQKNVDSLGQTEA